MKIKQESIIKQESDDLTQPMEESEQEESSEVRFDCLDEVKLEIKIE